MTGTFANLGSFVLVLGDGNLSFSLALARLFPKKNIVATVIESRDEFLTRYPSGAEILRHMNDLSYNIVVKFRVDATSHNDLTTLHQSTYFSDIIMNFPHHGGKTNLQKSKILLKKIFNCVSTCLMKTNNNRFHISFAKGQSGVNITDVLAKSNFLKKDFLPKHNADSWQAIYIGAKFALKVDFVDIFCANNFPGYQCTGYLNREQRFQNKELSITLSFVKAYDFNKAGVINLEKLILLEDGDKSICQSNFEVFYFFLILINFLFLFIS